MKIRSIIVSLALALGLLSLNAQNVTLNAGVDSVLFPSIQEPLNLWLSYLNSKDDSIGAQYWNTGAIEKYGVDYYNIIELEMVFGGKNYLALITSENFAIKILSVREFGEYYKIQSMLTNKNKETGEHDLYYNFHVYAKQVNNEWKLYNALTVNSELVFNSKTVGYLNYHFPKNHQFNLKEAERQNDFILKLCADFNVKPDTVEFYFAPTAKEILEVKGIDYVLGVNGLEIPRGRGGRIGNTNLVTTSATAEYFPHELVHVFLNSKHKNLHRWSKEGLATYLGGSRGHPLDWHLIRFEKYLKEHQKVNLDSMLNYVNVDRYTDYKYVLGGYIIQLVYENGGMKGLNEFLKSGRRNTDYYMATEKLLGVKQRNFNSYFRKSISEYLNTVKNRK